MLRSISKRKGATLVEFAIVAPVVFLLILGLIVGGLGVFRYQEVAHLAREGTRHASTHGGQYIMDGMPAKTGVPAISSNSDIQAYVVSKAVALDASKLTATVKWDQPSNVPVFSDPTSVPPGAPLRNYVTVTVSYQWMPEVFLVGPITLSSTSKVAMSY